MIHTSVPLFIGYTRATSKCTRQSGFNCGCHSTHFRFAFSLFASLFQCCPSPVCVFTCFLFSKYAVKNCGLHLRGPLNYFGICHSFAEPPCCFSRKNIENIHIYLGETPPSLLLAKCDTDAGALLHLRLIVWPNSPLFFTPLDLFHICDKFPQTDKCFCAVFTVRCSL